MTTTRIVANSSDMFPQPRVAESPSLRSPYRNAAGQAHLGDAQHVTPGSVTQDILHDKLGDLSKLKISTDDAHRHAAGLSYEDVMENVRVSDGHLYQVMVTYHKVIRLIRSEELRFMQTVRHYHRELEKLPLTIERKKLSQTEVDCEMDKHSAQLQEYDLQLKTWFSTRAYQNALMLRGNDRAIEKNVRRHQENIRWEERDRRGPGRGFKDHNRWLLDRERQLEEQNRWEQEYNLWVQTYNRFSQDRCQNLKEYRELFAGQAHFSRCIGNYQIARFFDEVERLNDAAGEFVKNPASHASKPKGKDETSKNQKKTEDGTEKTAAQGGSQGSSESGLRHTEVKRMRRNTM